MPPKKKAKSNKPSPYAILSRWLNDGSSNTKLPKELEDDKAINPTYLLYYFQQSKYIVYISEMFNNYDMYQMKKPDTFKFLKQCVLDSGYKPPFLQKMKTVKNKLYKILKMRFPYLKCYDIDLLIDIIDASEDKDRIYETVGLYKARKKKSTKLDKKRIEKIKKEPEQKVAIDDVMANFS
jgi:hypothetical protein